MVLNHCFYRGLCSKFSRPQTFCYMNRAKLSISASEPENVDSFKRGIPKTCEDHVKRRKAQVVQPEDPKVAKVAIIGLPNSGKSTLLNQLVEHRIASVSMKIHTTRKNLNGIFSQGSTQIEFLDTPGLVTLNDCVKHRLEHSLYHHPTLSANIADVIVVLVDVSRKIYRRFLAKDIYNILINHREKKSVLVLNKVDLVTPKRKLMYCVDRLTGGYIEGRSVDGKERKYVNNLKISDKRRLREILQSSKDKENPKSTDLLDSEIDLRNLNWPYFSRVFMISALTGDGVNDLRDYLVSEARPSPWKYPSSLVTCENPEHIITSIIREKFLDNCLWDVPYLLRYKVAEWNVDDLGNLHILARVLVPKDNQMAFVLGGKGATISKVADEARQELSDTFRCDVRLKILAECIDKKADKNKK